MHKSSDIDATLQKYVDINQFIYESLVDARASAAYYLRNSADILTDAAPRDMRKSQINTLQSVLRLEHQAVDLLEKVITSA